MPVGKWRPPVAPQVIELQPDDVYNLLQAAYIGLINMDSGPTKAKYGKSYKRAIALFKKRMTE